MLAIADFTSNNAIPTIGTDFLVTSISLVDDSTLEVWFTRPITNGDVPSNYTVTGPVAKAVDLVQYVAETRDDGVTYNTQRVVRIFFRKSFIPGQWTISFNSSLSTIKSNDADSLVLPTGTQIIFDIVDKSSQDSLGSGAFEGGVSRFIPKNFRYGDVQSAIIAGLETGDQLVSSQTRAAFDQYSISSASGDFLTTRASDRGIQKPAKLGISDDDFRKLAITVANNKLTQDSMLSVLEIMYGKDSVRGYVESSFPGPYEIFDKASLELLIDGNQKFTFIANWGDYKNPLSIDVFEIVTALNFAFDKNGIKAQAEANQGKLRIYSKTKGLRSSISITGGTLQPYLQLDVPVYGPITYFEPEGMSPWVITNPAPGIVRFLVNFDEEIEDIYNFFALHIGDYVTIIGSQFPLELRGSWPIVNVVFTHDDSNVFLQYFEIESSYIVV